MNIPDSGATSRTDADRLYENSAETGIVPGAEYEQNADTDAEEGDVETNAFGLTRTAGASTLSDNVTGNNSMGTSTIGGGLGLGSTNSNATLP